MLNLKFIGQTRKDNQIMSIHVVNKINSLIDVLKAGGKVYECRNTLYSTRQKICILQKSIIHHHHFKIGSALILDETATWHYIYNSFTNFSNTFYEIVY